MAEQYPPPVFLDATVLSNFASTDAITFLVELLDSPVVVPAVREEIERGRGAGHDYLAAAIDAFDSKLPIRDVTSDAELSDLRDRLDAGEAASLRGAIEYDGTLATDDLAARHIADGRSLPVTGSVGLLLLGIEQGHIDRVTADEWLDAWRDRRGYYAPVESVNEIIDEDNASGTWF